jgi:predicted nucleotidyltransferase
MKTLAVTHIMDLRGAVVDFLGTENVRIFLFGSRARGDNSVVSDVDIGVVPGEGFRKEKLALLREFIENLNVPYKVEIIDFSEVSEQFRAEALKDTVLWKD